MNSKLKLVLATAAVGTLIACGSGTAVPKNKKPVDYKTPTTSAAPVYSVKPNDHCTKKGEILTIKGKKYMCKEVSAKDKTLRWRR